MAALPGDLPDARVEVDLDGPYVLRHSLPGSGATVDETYVARPDSVRFAARTPEGAVAVLARVVDGRLRIDAWGDERLDELNRRNPGLRHSAHGCVVDNLLARVLGQRVLAVEAGRSWVRLCRELGDPAPGPLGLQLPPDHDRVANPTPSLWATTGSATVCTFFTGEARGSDEEMLALVARWEGQRGRVERLIHRSGHRIQRFAAGRPTPRIARL